MYPVLLLSDGVIVTPQMLNHAQPRKQAPDCVVEAKDGLAHVTLHNPADRLFCMTKVSARPADCQLHRCAQEVVLHDQWWSMWTSACSYSMQYDSLLIKAAHRFTHE